MHPPAPSPRLLRLLRLRLLLAVLVLAPPCAHAFRLPPPSLSAASLSRRAAAAPPAARSCRRALAACLADLDAGRACATLPTLPRKRVLPLPPATFNLTALRPGVHLYDDGAYLTLILFHARHLALVDFPDSPGSNLPNGTATLLSAAVDRVLAGAAPRRVDMIYSHEHFDHVGGATRFRAYLADAFPAADVHVWATAAAAAAIARSTTGRAPLPTRIIGRDGAVLVVGDALEVRLKVLRGHTRGDLLVHIPAAGEGQPGVAMLVDVVFPGWSPFSSFALAEDVRDYLEVHRELLQHDFEVFVGGHPQLGRRRDVHRNMRFIKDVVQAAAESSRELTGEQLGEAGIGRVGDPEAVEYGNLWFAFLGVFRRLEVAGCYRKVIEKWGCKLAGLDFTLESHCFAAVEFNLLDG